MGGVKSEAPNNEQRIRREPYWPGVLFQLHTLLTLIYGLVYLFHAKIATILFTLLLILAATLGMTAGAHRLWAHRSYSANSILRFILMVCQTFTGNGSIYDWVLDHRIHHKFHGTDDDPYNYKRGFFYAQVGTRMLSESPKRAELVKQIDMSDIEEDNIVMFQKKFYWVLMPILNFLLPINAPAEYWGENLLTSFLVVGSLRLFISLHMAWLINSARTIWGLYPGDRFYSDSNLVYILSKSYWHEYHYTVPWDCLTNEFGAYNCGFTTTAIKIWAALGWVTDIKTINSKGIIEGLKQSVENKRPINECIDEVAEEILNHPNDDQLSIY